MPVPKRLPPWAVGTALLALTLPSCAAPPLAPPVPLAELAQEHTPPAEDSRGARQEAPAAAAADGPGTCAGADPQQQVFQPWQTLHGGSDSTRGDICATLRRDLARAREDYGHFYSGENLGELALGVVVAAPLANTHADQAVRDYYQRSVRSRATDAVAGVARYGGEVWVTVPVALGAALADRVADDDGVDGAVGEWGNRSLRALAVGAPALFALQVGLGASRPGPDGSHWHPFADYHGASGHAFVGAVPFLTAAMMAEDSLWRYPLAAAALLPGLSRINDDKHYLSQVVLGWWLAYLATTSVRETETGQRWFRLLPDLSSGGPGVAAVVRY